MSDESPPPTDEPLIAEDAVRDEAEKLAECMLDVMKCYGRALKLLEESGFSGDLRKRLVRNARQMYGYMQLEIPHLFREELAAEVQATFEAEADEPAEL